MVGGVIAGVRFCGLRAAADDAPRAAPLCAGCAHGVFAPVAARLARQQAFTVAKHLSIFFVGKRAATVDEAPGVARLAGQVGQGDGGAGFISGKGRLARGGVARGGQQAGGGQSRCCQCSLYTPSQNHFQESTLCAYKVQGGGVWRKGRRNASGGGRRGAKEVVMCVKIFCLP